ncbi:MAG: fucose isomerase [Parasporobacterium sp.]|nr:fucose isomerase [Parasporobacterium sp.]
MIKRGLDVKLNVKPIFLGLSHQYYYEGPCRFAGGDGLQPEFEKIFTQNLEKEYFANVEKAMPLEAVNMLEPVTFTCYDDWRIPEEMFEKMTTDPSGKEVDVFMISAGIARSAYVIELAQRTGKPIIQDPTTYSDVTAVTAAIKARGIETFSPLTWKEVTTTLRVLRVRKALKEAKVLLGVRFDSNCSKSANDTFVSLDTATEKFGTQFRFLNLHELIDYMTPLPEGGNYTTPGRMNTPNVTAEDIKEAEALADELLGEAADSTIGRDMLVKSCIAYVEVKKLLDIHDCCGFTVPCPDTCSTRRLNEEKFTFCLTHSLLNEQGIPSACEYDVDGVLTMLILSTLTNHAPFMGNTNPIVVEDGKIRPLLMFNEEVLKDVPDKTNLYHSEHSTPNRRLKGIDNTKESFGLRYFAYDQKFGACMRYHWEKDKGQKITTLRISPDCKKLFIGSGEIVAGGDYDVNNCNGYVVYRVADQRKYYEAQLEFGNHLPLVYGDYTEELKMLGKFLGLEVVCV